MSELFDAPTFAGNSSPQEIINRAGDVTILALYVSAGGRMWDIKNFCPSFTIFEDIFSNFLSGEAVIVDAAGLISALRFDGTEYITVSFRTPTVSSKIEKSFSITAIKNRVISDTDRQEVYVIQFTSVENVLNNLISISKKLKGSTDKLVGDIYLDHLQTKRIAAGDTFLSDTGTALIVTGTPHNSTISFIPAYWSPIKCINWLAARSRGNNGTATNYLFFETTKAFYFTSVEDLIVAQKTTKTPIVRYIYYPGFNVVDYPDGYTFTFTDLDKRYSLVQEMSPYTYFDLIKNQDTGLYGSTLYTQDILLKEYREFVYDHNKNFDQYTHLEKGRPFSTELTDCTSTKRALRTKQYNLFNDFKDPMYQTWAPQRNSLLGEMNALKLYIKVPGRSDMEVGQIIDFMHPVATSGESMEEDPFLSGLYMVTAIKHEVTPNSYFMLLEITKDSFREAV